MTDPDGQDGSRPDGVVVAEAGPEPDERLTAQQRWVLVVTMAGTFMAIMDTYIVNVAVPSIQRDLGASFAQIELCVGGYILAYGLLLVTGGRLGDAVGYRTMFVAGLAGFTVASLACGLAPDPELLVLFRVLQGCTAALFFPQGLSLIQTMFRGAAQVRAFSVFTGTIGLAAIAGQLVGGALVEADVFGLGWRSIFLINVLIGGLVAPLALRVIPRSATTRTRLDLVGVGLLAAALLLLLIPLVEGRSAGWPGWMWAMLALSVPAFALFVGWERSISATRSPLIRPALFANRSFTLGNLVNFAFFAGSTGLYFVLTLHLQSGLGYSPLEAGLTFAPLAITFAGTSLLVPRVAARLGPAMLPIGYAINAVGGLLLVVVAAVAGDDLTIGPLIPILALIGIGQGLGVTPLLSAILGQVPPQDAGAASGVLETIGQVGMTLGISLLGLVFAALIARSGYAAGFSWALAVNLGFAVVAAVCAVLLTRPRPSG